VGVTASVGIGPNRMVARLACELARPATRPAGKPGEVVEVKPEEVVEFVGRLPISALPGIDEDWAARLREMGIRHAKDLAALPGDAVRRALGEWGRRVWEIAQGGDPQEKAETGNAPARSWEKGVFSVQFELRPPTEERERIRAALRAVTEEVGRRLRQRGQAARQVKLTLVFRDMRKVGARRTLRQPAGSAEVLFQAAGALFERMKLNGRLVRRVRVTVAHLAVGPNGGQMGLPLLEQEERRERLAEMVDRVKDRFGEASVRRASLHDASRALASSSSREAGNR
jgi:DNA polymerase-4